MKTLGFILVCREVNRGHSTVVCPVAMWLHPAYSLFTFPGITVKCEMLCIFSFFAAILIFTFLAPAYPRTSLYSVSE